MFNEEDDSLTEEEIINLLDSQELICNHPELKGTNLQLEALVDLNLRALKMDDHEKYPLKLIIAAFLVQTAGSSKIDPLDILESLKIQIDEWSKE